MGHHASIWQDACPVSHHGIGQRWLVASGGDNKGNDGNGGNDGNDSVGGIISSFGEVDGCE
jgi:hypothetical protein